MRHAGSVLVSAESVHRACTGTGTGTGTGTALLVRHFCLTITMYTCMYMLLYVVSSIVQIL